MISSMKLTGVVVRTTTPAYLYTQAANYGQLFLDRDAIKYWGLTFGVSGNTLITALQDTRKLVVTRSAVQASFTEKKTINTRLAPNVSLFAAQRLPTCMSMP